MVGKVQLFQIMREDFGFFLNKSISSFTFLFLFLTWIFTEFSLNFCMIQIFFLIFKLTLRKKDVRMPDAYERLLFDVLKGDHSQVGFSIYSNLFLEIELTQQK